jgi:hypothetical protein
MVPTKVLENMATYDNPSDLFVAVGVDGDDFADSLEITCTECTLSQRMNVVGESWSAGDVKGFARAEANIHMATKHSRFSGYQVVIWNKFSSEHEILETMTAEYCRVDVTTTKRYSETN